MKEKPYDKWILTAKIFTAISIAIFLLTFVLPNKARILVNIVLLLVTLYYLAALMLNKIIVGKLSVILSFEAVFLGYHLFRQSDYYSFTGNGMKVFYVVSLIIGILLGIVLPVLSRKTLKSLSEGIGKGVTIAVCATLISIILLPNLNYALDTNVPQCKTVNISGKRTNMVPRSSHTYEFMFENEGEDWFINVPVDIYDEYQSGDIYQVYICDGAFKREFYIAEDCF